MAPRLFVALLLGLLAGCSRPPELADTVIRAASAEELAAFRSGLAERFPADQLQPFDTALQELNLAALSDVPTAEARDVRTRAAVNGRTFRAAVLLGWQARRTRLLGETALVSGLLERALRQKERTAATGTPLSVTHDIENEQDILTRLRDDLAETDRRLTGLAAAKPGNP